MQDQRIRLARLSAVHYQHPDLAKATNFLSDFGLVERARHEGTIFYRGFGIDSYVYIAEKSPDAKRHFVGATWVVESSEELDRAAALQPSSSVRESNRPGGGRLVTLEDPNGFEVNLIYGQEEMEPRRQGADVHSHTTEPEGPANTALEKPRKGEVRRMQPQASPVHKLGHYGFLVPADRYKETMDWYRSHLTLKPTDIVYDPDNDQDVIAFLHIDRGLQFVDHHSFFIGVGGAPAAHIHHASFEVNDMDTQCLGHDWLRNAGWKNCWGVGRHVLGSQIFDYWFDASGNILEHYSDGDLVNSETPLRKEKQSKQSLYIWGPDVPQGFLDGSIGGLVEAPDVFKSTPAVLEA